MKVKELQELPRTMVGDGGKPNVFFVSVEPYGTILVVSDFWIAYEFWKSLRETNYAGQPTLEDRRSGVIASVTPKDDSKVSPLITVDDSRSFLRMFPSHNRRKAS